MVACQKNRNLKSLMQRGKRKRKGLHSKPQKQYSNLMPCTSSNCSTRKITYRSSRLSQHLAWGSLTPHSDSQKLRTDWNKHRKRNGVRELCSSNQSWWNASGLFLIIEKKRTNWVVWHPNFLFFPLFWKPKMFGKDSSIAFYNTFSSSNVLQSKETGKKKGVQLAGKWVESNGSKQNAV